MKAWKNNRHCVVCAFFSFSDYKSLILFFELMGEIYWYWYKCMMEHEKKNDNKFSKIHAKHLQHFTTQTRLFFITRNLTSHREL